jgi:hypothetical protein
MLTPEGRDAIKNKKTVYLNARGGVVTGRPQKAGPIPSSAKNKAQSDAHYTVPPGTWY